MMMYNEIIRDCFFFPRHVGVIDLSLPVSVVVKNNLKNKDNIELYMHCSQDGTMQSVCFKSNGNPYVIAGLEWLCRELEGKNINSLPQINYQLMIKELAIPTVQYPVALRIEKAYKEILLLMQKKLER